MRERKKGKTIFRNHHCALWIEDQRGVVDCSQLEISLWDGGHGGCSGYACMYACVRERDRERERSTRERKKGKTVFHYLHCALWLEYQRGAPSRPSLQLTVNSVRNEAQENHASQPAVAGTGCCGCPQGYSFYFGGAAGRGSQTASHASHRSTCGCW